MPLRAVLLSVVTALAMTGGAGGCSDEPADDPAEAVHTAPNGDVYSDADATFATSLVQHHALALRLVDISRTVETSEQLSALAAEVVAVQGPEIQTATAWLADWDLPVPETIRDHTNAHAAERGEQAAIPGGDLPGMPDPDDLAELEGLTGSAFERRWLELMITHHEGAIEIAEAQTAAGRFAPAVDLARSVLAAQREQVTQMKALLGR